MDSVSICCCETSAEAKGSGEFLVIDRHKRLAADGRREGFEGRGVHGKL